MQEDTQWLDDILENFGDGVSAVNLKMEREEAKQAILSHIGEVEAAARLDELNRIGKLGIFTMTIASRIKTRINEYLSDRHERISNGL